MRSLAVSTTSRQFKYEQDVDAGPGGNDWVVSPNRQNYMYQTVFDMAQTVGQLRHNARVGYAYQVRCGVLVEVWDMVAGGEVGRVWVLRGCWVEGKEPGQEGVGKELGSGKGAWCGGNGRGIHVK